MDVIIAFFSVFSIFGMGFLVQKRFPLSDDTIKQATWLVLNLFFPLFSFHALASGNYLELFKQAPVAILVGALFPVALYFITPLAFRGFDVSDKRMAALRFCMMLANYGFLGYPVCQAVWGNEGLIMAILVKFGTDLSVFTLGVASVSVGQSKVKNVFWLVVNPIIVATLAGIIFTLLRWTLPAWLETPIAALSGIPIPLAVFLAGAQVGKINLAEIPRDFFTFTAVAFKLLIYPAALWGLLRLFGVQGLQWDVLIMLAAMPTGLMTNLFLENYNGDTQLAASMTVFTTLGAMISLPLLAFLLLA